MNINDDVIADAQQELIAKRQAAKEAPSLATTGVPFGSVR